LVEHLICNQGATGSNPVAGTINIFQWFEERLTGAAGPTAASQA
jgi:hypothetical protein